MFKIQKEIKKILSKKNKMKTIKKILFLSASLLGLQMCLWLDFVNTTSFFSWADSEYNTWYQNAFSKAPLVNLFSQAADVATSRHLLAEKNSLDFIASKIKALWWQNECDVESDDVANIFLTTPAWIEMKKRMDMLDKKIKYPSWSDYNESCKKILKCYWMTGFNDLTSAWSLQCKWLVAQSYVQEIEKAHRQVNIEKPIINPDMFFNDKNETSSPKNIFWNTAFTQQPWDLMVDFNDINSILFKDPKSKSKTDEDMFSTSPPAWGQCKKACGFDEIKDWIDKALLWMSAAISNIKSLLNWEIKKTDKDKLTQLKIQLTKLKDSVWSNATTFNAISQWSQVGWQQSYENDSWEVPEWGGWSQKIDFVWANTQTQLATDTSDQISWASNNINLASNQISEAIKIIENAEKEDRELTSDEKKQISDTLAAVQSNMNQQSQNLTTASSATKALDKIVKLDTMLCVQVCWVETKKAWVIDWWKVNSIEEIIDQYQALFSKVKNSWAMMKQRVTDEFWETSFQDLKLKNLVNIDFVVTTKPVFDNKTLANKMDSEKLEIQRIREWVINQATSIEDTKEKNKYLVLYSPEDRKLMDSAEKTIQNLQAALEKQQENYAAASQDFAKVNMQWVNTNSLEKMNLFVDELMTFTEQMWVIFKSFKDSSEAFLNNIMQWT